MEAGQKWIGALAPADSIAVPQMTWQLIIRDSHCLFRRGSRLVANRRKATAAVVTACGLASGGRGAAVGGRRGASTRTGEQEGETGGEGQCWAPPHRSGHASERRTEGQPASAGQAGSASGAAGGRRTLGA